MAKTRILIVEDESLVAKDIQAMILNLGYAVAGVVSSGEKALQKIEDNCPGLILMDIVLKGSLDGIATAEKIRARCDVPIVYLTAYADEATVNRAKLTEPFGYLLKPFEERELQTTIEMALHKHARETQFQERERWILSILDNIQDAVIAADPRGRISFMNVQSEQLSGWKTSELKGRDVSEVLRIQIEKTGRAALPSYEDLIRRGRWTPGKPVLLTTKDGRRIPIDTTATLIHDVQGNPGHLVFLFRKRVLSKRQEEKFFQMAVRDAQTGLPNRLLFADRLTLAMAQARRRKLKIALILVELDDFQAVNEKMGSAAADKVLQETGRRLVSIVRKSDTVARIRDAKFMLVLAEIKHPPIVLKVAGRIRESLRPPIEWKGHSISVSASAGISLFPDDGEDVETLTRNAEAAASRVKSSKGNRIQFFSS